MRVAELLKQMEYRQRSRFGERGGIAPRELRRRLGLDEESVYLFPLGSFPAIWNRDTEVAVIEELAWIGGEVLTQEHLDSAAWMWWTYCSLVNQVIRKPAAWAAALHSCIAFVEDWQITQEEIAVGMVSAPRPSRKTPGSSSTVYP